MKNCFRLVAAMCAISSCATVPPAENLDAYMTTLGNHGFSGVVLVAIDGEIVHRSAHGWANRRAAVPNTVDTAFDLGSLSKQFTAAAILHLEERELVRVGDPLSMYFENVPEDKRAITIHQLLTHTAALPRYVYHGDFVETTRDEAVALALNAPLVGVPGRRYRYSDTGYGLAAAIVEIVSGLAFTEYVKRYLFEPAGMVRTGFYNDEVWRTAPVAHGYAEGRHVGAATPRPGLVARCACCSAVQPGLVADFVCCSPRMRPGGAAEERILVRPGPYWGILGFGGVISTADDLMRWRLALEAGTVLRRETVERMFEPHVREGSSDSWYGYGWVVMPWFDGDTVTGHDGATNSYNSALYYHDGRDILVVALSNAIDRRGVFEVFYASGASEALLKSITGGELSIYPSFVH